MKPLWFLPLLAGLVFSSTSLASTNDLIPQPSSVTWRFGTRSLGPYFCVQVAPPRGESPESRVVASIARFARRLSTYSSITLATSALPCQGRVDLKIQYLSGGLPVQDLSEDESYSLSLGFSGIVLRAPNPLGVIHGLETLLQLLVVDGGQAGFRLAKIQDTPRFRWRGLLVDPCRHWLSMDTLKRNLDSMSAVKLNVMHLHLSDDQAFRMESKLYPKLQNQTPDGNFYTQAQMTDLIAYARERGVRIVPEFDVPGHSTSWFVAYPDLAAAPGPFQLPPNIVDAPGFAFDPTKAEVYRFLTDFFSEMSTIFPDAYLHIGGDEVNGVDWDNNPAIQAFMVAHSLHGHVALQAYFNTHLFQIVSRLGKKMLGWNEIADPSLPPGGIAIEAWTDPDALRQAVQRGFSGISSYGLYLDNMLTAADHLAADPLDMSSSPTPLTPEEEARILGGEACMWSEVISEKNVDDRIWPRMIAIAELLWSAHEHRPLDDVYRRMYLEDRRLQSWGNRDASSYSALLAGLVGEKAEPAFQRLADFLTPVKFYARFTDVITPSDPLSRLVDAVLADTLANYSLGSSIDRYLAELQVGASKDDAATSAAIRAQLVAIVDAHDSAVAGWDATGLAAGELAAVDKLSEVAADGIEALDALNGGLAGTTPYDPMRKPRLLDDLGRDAAPSAEVLVAIVPAVSRLVTALPDHAPPALVRSSGLR